ncbi:MAG: primosomal protein N' [Deltaproteobacteria bacterium]|nr:primosomal protein N' [Deltaproteobacteria bacterium]
MFLRVAVNIPSEKVFTYSVPEELENDVLVGKRVLVPFGKRKMTGYILEVATESEWDDTKDILAILDRDPLFSEKDLLFYRWMSDYYMHPLGKSLKSILPRGIDVESNSWLSLGNEKAERKLTLTQQEIIEIIGTYPSGVSTRTLKKAIKKNNIYDDIRILQGLNLITVEDRLKNPDVKRKMEKCFSLTDDYPRDVKLTEKQQEIVDFLKERGESSLSLLRGTFRHAPSTTRSLERKGIAKSSSREVYRKPTEISLIGIKNEAKTLTDEQKTALDDIVQGISSATYMPYLLHGVTGSGKTEVYFRAIEEVLKLNGSVIFLVPEIALTPQLLSRVNEKFDDNDIAVLHSGISQSEKYDEWRRIQKGEARIVIGVRSAIFAPACNLRLIIIDEEHDTSYKQDDRMTYNARNLALVRAKLNSVTVILGTATPGIQTYYNTHERNFRYLHLTKRIDDRPLPRVDIIDMKEERTAAGSVPIVSRSLKEAMEETLQSGKQTLLFLNRRGYTTFLYCLDCGYIFKCLNCSVSMTHHIDDSTLRCHYCNYTIKAPPICPECCGYRINSYGVGTEKVEGEIKSLFPEARIERMDSDTTQKRGSFVRILKGLDGGDIDILIGTQMITKGHDYPNVTLVGVLSADTSLNIPDFRAAERTFQIITQVSGRGGRGDTPGRVIVQTFNPDHYAIQRAREHDCLGFYADELSIRRELSYPPFSRMVNFRISSLQRESAMRCASKVASIARQLSCNGNMENKVKIMGPAEAPIAKIKGRYRWHMLLMGENVTTLHRLTRNILANTKTTDSTVTVDVDPINFL